MKVLLGRLFPILCLTMWLTALPAAAQTPGWKAGWSSIDITPREPIWLFGHTTPNRISTGVAHRLYAKVLVIQDQAASKVAIVAIELPGLQRKEADEICALIQTQTGLERKDIVLNFSHTHSGPVMKGLLTPGYRVIVDPPDHWTVIEAYTRWVQQQIAAAVAQACKDLRPVELAYGQGSCDIRNKVLDAYQDDDPQTFPNPDKEFNDRVPILRVSDANGKIVALMFGYASHPKSAGRTIHGGYGGYAQGILEKAMPGTQAMFIMGCGAESVTDKGFDDTGSEADGQLLAQAVQKALQQRLAPLPPGKLKAVFGQVTLPFAGKVTLEQLKKRRADNAQGSFGIARDEFLLEHLEKHGEFPTGYTAPLQAIQLGPDLTFIALSGEISTGYAERLEKKEFPGRRLWVAGFSNDGFAYVPTELIMAKGRAADQGRVAGTSMQYWGWPSWWAKGIEQKIIQGVKDLLAE